jgi:hypothetical protein
MDATSMGYQAAEEVRPMRSQPGASASEPRSRDAKENTVHSKTALWVTLLVVVLLIVIGLVVAATTGGGGGGGGADTGGGY